MDYIHKNIEDMTLPELQELCNNHEKYGLTWGEYMKLLDGIQRAQKLSNPESGDSSAEIDRLKLRVTRLEQALAGMTKFFADIHASLEGNDG